MSKELMSLEDTQEYLSGVLNKVVHHAGHVRKAFLELFTLITAYKDKGTHLRVRTIGNELKNVVWVHIKGKRYVFTYNHRTCSIEMLEGSLQGRKLEDFRDDTDTDGLFCEYFEIDRGED